MLESDRLISSRSVLDSDDELSKSNIMFWVSIFLLSIFYTSIQTGNTMPGHFYKLMKFGLCTVTPLHTRVQVGNKALP